MSDSDEAYSRSGFFGLNGKPDISSHKTGKDPEAPDPFLFYGCLQVLLTDSWQLSALQHPKKTLASNSCF